MLISQIILWIFILSTIIISFNFYSEWLVHKGSIRLRGYPCKITTTHLFLIIDSTEWNYFGKDFLICILYSNPSKLKTIKEVKFEKYLIRYNNEYYILDFWQYLAYRIKLRSKSKSIYKFNKIKQ